MLLVFWNVTSNLSPERVQRTVRFLATPSISHLIFPKMSTEGKEENCSYLMQRLEVAFQAHLQPLQLFLKQSGSSVCCCLCKPLRASRSDPTPAPQNFSSAWPPPPPLRDTPPVISYVNHKGCRKTWSRISSFLCVYQLGNVTLWTPVIDIPLKIWDCL